MIRLKEAIGSIGYALGGKRQHHWHMYQMVWFSFNPMMLEFALVQHNWSRFNTYQVLTIKSRTVDCTEVRFSSLFSGGFITAIVVNPPERKLAKRTSVHCQIFSGKAPSCLRTWSEINQIHCCKENYSATFEVQHKITKKWHCIIRQFLLLYRPYNLRTAQSTINR